MKRENMDLTRGMPLWQILTFAIPLILGNVFQQLYHFVDASVIGVGCGVEALAAVSCTSWMCWLINALCRDSGNAFSIQASICVGKGDMKTFHTIVVNALWYYFIVSCGSVLLLLSLMRFLLSALSVPESILQDAGIYLTVYVLCIFPMMIFQLTTALLRALGNSQVTMTAMIVSTLVNIFLDLLFVLVFRWAVFGAALATFLSILVSAVIGLLACRREGLLRGIRQRMDKDVMMETLRLMFPLFFNSVIISLGGLIVQSRSNLLGAAFAAGYSAQGKLFSLLEAIIMAIQSGLSVFVGQNLGARKIARIRRGIHQTIIFTFGLTVVMITLVILNRPFLLGLFLSKEDAALYQNAFEVAMESTRVIMLGMLIMTPMYMYRASIQSLRKAQYGAYAGVGQLIIRILTITLGPSLIGIYAYYITDCMAWLVSLPIVSIPVYRTLKEEEKHGISAPD